MCNIVKTSRLAQLLVCLMLVALAPLAQANVLSPGNSNVAPDVFGPISGPVLASISGTVSAITFSASFTTTVIADPANHFCVGCLDYTYTYTNNGPDVNGRYSAGFFSGFMTDVGFVSGPGLAPNTVDRSGGVGAVVGFNYLGSNQVDPGQSTVTLVVETNTRQFKPGFLSAQDGTAASAAAFEPTFIPEPSSLFLLGGGLLAIGSFVRRFRLR